MQTVASVDRKGKAMASSMPVPTPRQVTTKNEPLPVTGSGQNRPLGEGGMWLARVQNLPADRLNDWVISWIFQSPLNEDFVAQASSKTTLNQRLVDSGLSSLLDPRLTPTKKCAILPAAQRGEGDGSQ